MPDKLPEEFAPTGPKLSRFPIRPAAPIRPRLFADEARFAGRLAMLCGGTELAAWVLLEPRFALLWALLRLLRPFWAQSGTRASRPAIAIALLAASAVGIALSPAAGLWAALPALGDLAATAVADAITVERRPAAFAWLDIGHALGATTGVALAVWHREWAPVVALGGLALALPALRDLRDRGTPRSAWPLSLYASVLRTPLCAQLCVLCFACAGLAFLGGPQTKWAALLPLAGMAVAARVEPRMPNAMWLPRIAAALAAAGLLWPPLGLFALGVLIAAVPAAVARAAGEMERPLQSSLAWMSLGAGAAMGAVLH